MAPIKRKGDLAKAVRKAVDRQPVLDMHTHIFDPKFGGLLLWGIDELVTYHYLVAEVMRYCDMPVEDYWRMDKRSQADLIWDRLFIRNSPLSEATRGVVTCVEKFGVSMKNRSLDKIRDHFKGVSVEEHVDRVFKLANVEAVVMTNNPFDPDEAPIWERGVEVEERFVPALRIDDLLVNWPKAAEALRGWGYEAPARLTKAVYAEIRRFLNDWIDRMDPVYFAASLPPTFAFPDNSNRGKIMEHCILPVSRERSIPFAMMIGVKKLVNPALQVAGDGVGKSDICAVETLCREFPDNKFLVTYLARENQHELCIAARKFRNLMPFGCWWFLNDPSIIEEMTYERLELLGTSFVPQHSDARVLDQLIYKWTHSREVIAEALTDKYLKVFESGWPITEKAIRKDVENLLSANFKRFVGLS